MQARSQDRVLVDRGAIGGKGRLRLGAERPAIAGGAGTLRNRSIPFLAQAPFRTSGGVTDLRGSNDQCLPSDPVASAGHGAPASAQLVSASISSFFRRPVGGILILPSKRIAPFILAAIAFAPAAEARSMPAMGDLPEWQEWHLAARTGRMFFS